MARDYLPRLDTTELPWTVGGRASRALARGRVQHGPELVQQKWFFRELSRDDETGAETLLFRHTGGLCYPAAGYHSVFEEAFLLEGEIRAFEDSPDVPNVYKPHYYFYRPPGWIHDSEIAAIKDTLILRMTGGQDSRIAAEWDRIGRKRPPRDGGGSRAEGLHPLPQHRGPAVGLRL